MDAYKTIPIFFCLCFLYALYCCSFPGTLGPTNLNYVADIVQKQRAAPISEFEISHDSSTKTWHVVGAGLQRFVQMTNWRCNFIVSKASSAITLKLLTSYFCETDTKILIKDFNMFWRHVAYINL